MKIKEEIEKELNNLIELGVLIKTKEDYIDSAYSRKIDKMEPRKAFLEGLHKGEQNTKKISKGIALTNAKAGEKVIVSLK